MARWFDVVCGRDWADVIKLKKKLHNLEDDLVVQEDPKKRQKTEAEIEKMRAKIDWEIREDVAHEVVVAFVSFNDEKGCIRCLEAYAKDHTVVMLGGVRKTDLKLGANFLRVDRAPDPSDLIWENLPVTPKGRLQRICFSAVCTLCMLLVTVFVVAGAKDQLKVLPTDVICKDLVQGVKLDCRAGLAVDAVQQRGQRALRVFAVPCTG